MFVFDRPNKAFRDFEAYLARCRVEQPPTKHPIPTLWDRAKTLFQSAVASIVSIASLAIRVGLSRLERKTILTRLVPIENMVRTLMIVEALTFLLMTPEGAKLRREAKPVPLPEPRKPFSKPKPEDDHARFKAALVAVHASLHPDDPHLVPRFAPGPEPVLAEPRTVPAEVQGDPLRRAPFRIFKWNHPEPEDWNPPAKSLSANGPHVVCLDDAWLAREAMKPKVVLDEDEDETANARDLARRFAALERVLANPHATIRRLARFLAGLPRDALPDLYPSRWHAYRWPDGGPEYLNAGHLAVQAMKAFTRTEATLDSG